MAIRPAHYHSRRRKFIEESMARIDLHCLHGTFQHPGVWAGLAERLARGRSAGRSRVGTGAARQIHVVAEPIDPPAEGRAPAWARGFCARLPARPAPGRRVLLGYSLGGRLALHVLAACPGAWDAAVVVAAHPGGGDAEERAAVRRRDEHWAARCRRGPLADLLREWDESPVFGGRPNRAPRRPEALDAERQARMFEAFTRGEQADLRPALAAVRLPPTLYVTGADDARYVALGAELARLLPSLSHAVVPHAGHRVPWDRPAEFADLLREFLESVG